MYLSWKSNIWHLDHTTVLSPALIMLLSHSSTSSACLQQKKNLFSSWTLCRYNMTFISYLYLLLMFNQNLLMIAELTRSLHLLTASLQLTFVLCVNSDLHFESWIWPLEPAPYCMRFNNENQMLYWNEPCVTFGNQKQMWSEVEEKEKERKSVTKNQTHSADRGQSGALTDCVCVCVGSARFQVCVISWGFCLLFHLVCCG